MGGLWSDLVDLVLPQPPPPPRYVPRQFMNSPSPASFRGNVTTSRAASSTTVPTRVSSSASRNVYSWQEITTQEPARMRMPMVSSLPLAPSVYGEPDAEMWNRNPLPHGKSFQLVNVPKNEDDFLIISRDFYNGAKGKHFKICKIERVENPYLLGYYLLKKEEMKRRLHKVREVNCFHGTKKVNIDSICENNFNWRLHGDSTGNRYGKGVSFSPISYYASHYSDKKNSDKIMFYVKVLISNITDGNETMVIPPKLHGNVRFDTAIKGKGQVVVKFSDNEFYPEFIIHYRILPQSA